jgi:hypothetical protein
LTLPDFFVIPGIPSLYDSENEIFAWSFKLLFIGFFFCLGIEPASKNQKTMGTGINDRKIAETLLGTGSINNV